MKTHTKKCKSVTPKYHGDVRNIFPDEVIGQCDCDGYHTFDELYEHRITLFIALCRLKVELDSNDSSIVWRSEQHSDGSKYDGWFILGINWSKGMQITYHLPLSKWDETDFVRTLDKAPEFDGHTSDDVLNRLKNL